MSEEPEQIRIDRAVPVDRDAEDALRFLALPGIWIHPARHPEDLVSFFAVTRHRQPLWCRGWPDIRPGIRPQHDATGELTQRRKRASPYLWRRGHARILSYLPRSLPGTVSIAP